ncbi:hypothetical protein V6957_002519 [Vibrio parahaemolyticus]|uniref:hypothetical protein n=1 Tax=Vibrio harveyi group TaxID=717610 RepID=UPI0005F0E154|nr:hypothetical protein [Vibrio parahaemolyticus]EGQ8952991.1 hypothetical protein [Vibrio parahaemolyticus]EGQ8987384.1 hypothetical protein [Vibrio parahaemolyticus]EGQ9006580.1 hypothetical protein [Vibrio parahaemolyticus]EGR2870276.1 hypothetical protein [Vibrio parahaemolyticus]EGR2895607.1 hypothetical protein [Vibrio parahaemolyticus]
MILRKRLTVDQIAASIRSRNHVDDFPSLERLKAYEQWKSGTVSKILDDLWLYQEQRTKIELHELEQAISYRYKRQLILFSLKVAAIFVATAAVYVIQLM